MKNKLALLIKYVYHCPGINAMLTGVIKDTLSQFILLI